MPTKKKTENKPLKTTTFLHKDKPLQQHINEVAEKDRKSVMSNPKINPAGKLKVQQTSQERIYPASGGYYRTVKVDTNAAPDPRNAARLRSNKARGTQSSATRVPVK